ncbi:MAG: DNA repair protein RecO [Patescibacteria group bacterium]
MLYKTQGIIIKKSNLGEFDHLITIYTKEFGKILLKGKSTRKNQAKLKGHLELFLNSCLMVAPARGFDIITGAETVRSFSYLHNDLLSLSASFYLSELIDKLIPEPEKDDQIWDLILYSFQAINNKNSDTKIIVNNFESKLLEFLGYGSKQENNLDSIQSILNEKINSKYFLQKEFDLLI